jgi:RNA polymerase sigma factor (sigma-70 family)
MVDPRPAGPLPDPAPGSPVFARVYRDYAPRVARWAARLAGIDGDAEDVVQEVFLVVSRKLDGFHDAEHLTSWIFAITRKIAANHRRRARWRRLWTGGDQLASLQAEGAGPDAALERRRLVLLFQRALDQLNDKQRTVFVLYELEGQSTMAIAELTRRNHSTVKVQLARARAGFIAAYQRLLRRECDEVGTSLAQLAQKLVNQDVSPIARWGKKTS